MKTILSLLPSLRKATENDKLSWLSEGKDRFLTTLPDGHQVVVWGWVDDDTGAMGLSVCLRDKSGEMIDISTADQFSPEHGDIERFFSAARRSAYDVTSVIEDLEKVLLKLQ
jgi:hypothetical protein